MTLNRRNFLQGTAGVAAWSSLNWHRPLQAGTGGSPAAGPMFVATWPFGIHACRRAAEVAADGSMLDAIEQGIRVTEADVENASVGIGGIPNADGQVELDACIMAGPGHAAGSVAALRDIAHPISVARQVMEQTPHVMLVGDNARKFALAHGHQAVELLTDNQRKRWEAWKAEQASQQPPPSPPPIDEQHHDTIAMLGRDAAGNLFGGCSTSGWGYKIPGRVGDSPIIGSGLYVDNTAGAAGATGLGENVMRHCGSFLVVEMMRQGADPTRACEMAIERIAELDPLGFDKLSVNFVALDKQGRYGAAGTNQGFKFSVVGPQVDEVLEGSALTEEKIGPEGGNIR